MVASTNGDALYLIGHDILGWTYPLPDAAGALVDARAWSPYGVEQGGAQPGPGYTGEWWDDTVGLQYLRARWYDPGVGRFTSQDVWEGERREPLSLNPYVYVLANPIRHVDPSGRFPGCQVECPPVPIYPTSWEERFWVPQCRIDQSGLSVIGYLRSYDERYMLFVRTIFAEAPRGLDVTDSERVRLGWIIKIRELTNFLGYGVGIGDLRSQLLQPYQFAWGIADPNGTEKSINNLDSNTRTALSKPSEMDVLTRGVLRSIYRRAFPIYITTSLAEVPREFKYYDSYDQSSVRHVGPEHTEALDPKPLGDGVHYMHDKSAWDTPYWDAAYPTHE